MGFNPDIFGNTDLMNMIWYAFLIFFAGLVFYLQRESRREGYPLEQDTDGKLVSIGAHYMPPQKTYELPNGETVTVPNDKRDDRPIAARPVDPNPGAPLEPTGNPMADGFGPAAYAERADHPDMTHHGENKIVPLRKATDFSISKGDADPRGMTVVGLHQRDVAGTVVDVWVDRGEQLIRYLEIETNGVSPRRVLVPMPLAAVNKSRREVQVRALQASQFAEIPATRDPDEITMLEEDRISAFVGSGYLYATPQRREPLL